MNDFRPEYEPWLFEQPDRPSQEAIDWNKRRLAEEEKMEREFTPPSTNGAEGAKTCLDQTYCKYPDCACPVQPQPGGDREAITSAVREHLRKTYGYACIQISDGIERIYFSGVDLSVVADAILSLPSAPVSGDWRSANDVPPLKRGTMQEYVLAVYRSHSGKIYSFAGSYLNAYPLQYRHECPKGDGCSGDGCDDGCPTTGWFVQVGDDDDAAIFQSLSLKDGDKIMGWRDIPQWDASCQTAPVSGRDAAIEECAKIAFNIAFAARQAIRSAKGRTKRLQAVAGEETAQQITKAILALSKHKESGR